ncbi:MAG: glycosyltransferase family 4 protein, partial [Chloroflexota bacterium]
VETLVAAFAGLLQRSRTVRLLMLGATAGDSGTSDRRYENQIRLLLDQPTVRGHVGWTGFVQASDVAGYLRASDLCVLPFRDGVSLRHGTLIAAIAHHLPIITTRAGQAETVGLLPDLLDGENALLVPPGDPTALLAAIERAALDAELRRRLSSEIVKVAEAFQWDTIAGQTLRLYQEIGRVV